jgi:hypothetical protein
MLSSFEFSPAVLLNVNQNCYPPDHEEHYSNLYIFKYFLNKNLLNTAI